MFSLTAERFFNHSPSPLPSPTLGGGSSIEFAVMIAHKLAGVPSPNVGEG